MSNSELDQLLSGEVLSVAPALLGWTLESTVDGVATSVMITETEAYAGPDDPASHAYRGMTRRNHAMFEPAGALYVYRSYGIHWCMNVVVGAAGMPHAVLLRGGEVLTGRDIMVGRRGRATDLSNGPGKLCQALGVTGHHDGSDIRTGPIRLGRNLGLSGRTIERTPRIGISKATDRHWRFIVVGQR